MCVAIKLLLVNGLVHLETRSLDISDHCSLHFSSTKAIPYDRGVEFNTCLMVQGRLVYMVAYGPLVNGNFPGISSSASWVSVLVYTGLMSMPWLIQQKITVTVLINNIFTSEARLVKRFSRMVNNY